MAKVREVVVGGVAGWMASAVMTRMLKAARQAAICHCSNYQHKQGPADTIPFMDVYAHLKGFNQSATDAFADRQTARDALGVINWNCAIYPETQILGWQTERILVLLDTNPHEEPSSEREIIGLVLVRYPDSGPFRPAYDTTARYAVRIHLGYAENRNTYRMDSYAEICDRLSDEDIIQFARQMKRKLNVPDTMNDVQ